MKRLLLLALLLACVVVPLGAYVRLSDAGLGCPDWPGCYGQLSPHHAADHIAAAVAANPDGPVSAGKAWKEMIHRYLASTLGVLVLGLCWLAWRRRQQGWQAAGLLLLLLLQGMLGMWTVTLLLKPAIVTAHLLGGMSIVALLAWWCFVPANHQPLPRRLALMCWLLPLLVLGQIALGGWVSSNYAALACQGFPACNGSLMPPDLQFAHAFHWQRELGESADGTPLSLAQLAAIHWSHRLGALLLASYITLLMLFLWRWPALRGRLRLLGMALLLQVLLGAANVWLMLPLPLAVMHNIGAMLLLAAALQLAVAVRVRTVAAWQLAWARGRG